MADRGFDRSISNGTSIVGLSVSRPLIDESVSVHGRASRDFTKKLLAASIIGVLMLSAGLAVAPGILRTVQEDGSPAQALAGEREVTYRYTDFFNLGKKPEAIGGYSAYQELGRWNGTPGPPLYFDLRQTGYGEWIVRDTYPYVLGYNPYSTMTSPDVDIGPVLTSWYKLYLDANNITDIGTGIGEDPIFVPTLGQPDQDGGWYNLSWYSTYMNTQEIADARAAGSLHYSEFYYGADWGAVGMPKVATDDGYWHELQGTMNFNRQACKKLLGLPATGDLETEFTAARADIEYAWYDKYMTEGGGIYDTYTAYDYSNDVRQVTITVDPDYIDSDPDTLYLRFWSISWGNDVLLIRYLEQAGVWKYMQAWCDDWYLNMTVGPDQGDIDMRAVIGYHLTAWKDSQFFTGGWSLETVHLDWCGNTNQHPATNYDSPYNPYDPDETNVMHKSWAPGTTHYGADVSYPLAPLEWDLAAGEKMVIELPPESQDVIGYEPYVGASDTLGTTKLAEFAAHSYWGTLTVGNGWPYSGDTNLKNYYDEETRTMTLVGPIDFPRSVLAGYPSLLDSGTPAFFFDVSNVTEYELSIAEPGPYLPGVDYTLTVTAKNNTGAVIVCNNTVDLSSDDLSAVFGMAAYKFNFSDDGVWTTTVRLSDVGSWTVYADDRYYTPDVDGSLGVTAIPEFGMILIPVVGVAAMMLLMRSVRRRKSK